MAYADGARCVNQFARRDAGLERRDLELKGKSEPTTVLVMSG